MHIHKILAAVVLLVEVSFMNLESTALAEHKFSVGGMSRENNIIAF